MVNFDGFLLSHTKEPVTLYTQEQVDAFLPKDRIPHALNSADPRSVGASGSPEYYFQLKKNLAEDMRLSKTCIEAACRRFKKFFGTQYHLIDTYRMDDADIAYVIMGSTTSICREAVDRLREGGIKAGIVKLWAFRPFPENALKKALGRVSKVIAIDVNQREIVFSELKSAIYPKNTPVFGYTVGVGGVEVSPDVLRAIGEEVNALDAPKESYSLWRGACEKPVLHSAKKSVCEQQTKGSSEFVKSGHRACAGCTASLVMRHVLDVLGKKTHIAMPACCWSIIAGPNPYTPVSVPLMHCAFETAAATATGIKRAKDQLGEEAIAVAFAGDGGTFDIGLQALSGAAERGEDIIYICYDNEAYMNTGGQRSSSTPQGAITETTPYPNVKSQAKKNMLKIMAAHGVPYAATASIYHLEDFKMKLEKAKAYAGKGLRFIQVLAPCNPGWKIPPELSLRMAHLAVETKAFPLVEFENGTWRITYRPERPVDLAEYLKPQGRFAKLTAEDIERAKKNIDTYWEELEKLEKYFS
jgi:pyruvate ferredoxin oxidoreductase beta subunit/2-oxoisovalerate ferredoxin oxidoreductase beta subunit